MRKTLIVFFAFSILPSAFLHSQWYQQSVPVSKPITGIKFIDSLKGWACTSNSTSGDNSYIIHTSNGGTNWYVQYTVLNSTLASLWVIDSTIAYAGGYDFVSNINQLFKTTNGGNNWINKNPPSVPTDIFFINKDSGWYCDDFIGPDVRTTTDGGQTWQLRISGISAATQRVFFLNYNTGWCAANFWCYKTTNAGLNWVQIGNFSDQVKSVYFLDENTGWLGGVDKFLYTSNSGTNWIETSFPPLFGSITDMYFFNFERGYGGNRSLRILITTNGGNLWGYQRDSSASYRVSFFDTLKGWTGDYGISHTINGGGPINYVGIININNKIPKSYILYQNYPNPFNSQTIIRFAINKTSYVQLKIYDILGREKTIWNSDKLLSAGTHELSFDAQNYSSGVYFYQLTVLNEQSAIVYKETRKMILVK